MGASNQNAAASAASAPHAKSSNARWLGCTANAPRSFAIALLASGFKDAAMSKTLGWLASELGGEVLGNPELEIRRVVHPSYAEDEHDLALVYSASVASIVKERAVQ